MAHTLMIATFGLTIALAAAGCGRAPEPSAGDSQREGPSMPAGAGGWTAAGPVEVWDTETIYDYIDGHAEVYLAYGMQGCRSQRYSGPEGEADIVVDLFEMASAADAFGVFTHDRDGEEAAVGQGGLYRWGWLSFWKGRFFVSITAEDESEAAKAAVLELGRQVAASIEGTGEPPALVTALPVDGLEPHSVRYLHHPLILAAHVPVGLDDPFELGETTPAVLGRYRDGDAAAWLLVVDYPDHEAASRVVASRGGGPVESGRGFAGARVLGADDHRAAFVLEAATPGLVTDLLDAAAIRADGGGE